MTKYGAVCFEGKEYILTGAADFTATQLPFSDEFEMSTSAIDKEGNKYIVYWIFSTPEGEWELDSLNYDNVNRVESV